MSERFCVKEYDNFELFFDKKQEYIADYKCIGIRLAPMTPEQVVDLLNENERLKREIDELNISISLYDDDVTRLLNENKRLQEEKEHYRKYAILYLQDFDLYSDDFIETIRSINGDEFANKMLKDREEIINALKREGLYE